jgi:HK97 family phage major capsid protein
MTQHKGPPTVLDEPLTYERGLPFSYFRDRAMAEHNRDEQAQKRLQRHAREAEVEVPRMMEARSRRELPEGAELRVNPNRVDGTGGYFSPPLWANEYFATAPRPKRVLAGMIPNFPLDAKVSEVKMPRLTTGANVEPVTDVTAVPNRDLLDAASETVMMTLSGVSDVAMQLLEQSPPGAHLDHSILKDCLEAYDFELEKALFTGLGKADQQIAGILNLATGAGAVTTVEFSGTKGYELFSVLGKLASQLGDARLLPPEVWMMRTARWCWLGSSEDEEKLPLAVPGHQAIPPVPYTFDADRPAVAPPILGWPTYLSDAIPATLGPVGEANRDTIVTIRPTDSMLFETPKHTGVLTEVLSGTLQARITLHGYAGALFRYPTGIAYLTGAGMKVESGF